jgi:hypothetical protein
LNAKQREIDTPAQHLELINRMCWDLHTIFHEVVRRNIYGFSDDPTMPVRVLYAQGEEVRENMARSEAEKAEDTHS